MLALYGSFTVFGLEKLVIPESMEFHYGNLRFANCWFRSLIHQSALVWIALNLEMKNIITRELSNFEFMVD